VHIQIKIFLGIGVTKNYRGTHGSRTDSKYTTLLLSSVQYTCLTASINPSFKWFSRERFGFLCRADDIVRELRKSHISSSFRDSGRGGFTNDGYRP